MFINLFEGKVQKKWRFMDAVVVFCACPDPEQALEIANALVEARLAACVNISSAIRSVYRWQGVIERADEVLLIIKTTEERFPALRDRIQELHPYDTPEIIALPVTAGSEKYLTWLREQL